ncbi:MAG: DsbA family protein [Patescibacteria group bacterium]|nr:DsbA family protein [Patescibacteria group bacterium]MDD4610759.1 DsbA family protein [Patescibacteria group bacterium]
MQYNSEDSLPKKKWYKKWWGILIIIWLMLLLVLLAAMVFYILDMAKKIKSGELPSQQISQTLETGTKYNAEGINNYWLGSSEPKLTIVEFADFNCPRCKNTYSTIREISLNYKDDVKIIFRDYPVIASSSLNLALAARCAGEQGKFWEMHDKLFQNQGKFNSDNMAEISTLAQKAGVENSKFETCFNTQKYLKNIKKDYSDAENLEITGTPTWFFNGYKLAGEIPREVFTQIIDNLLKQ